MTIAAVLACEMLEDETSLALGRAFPDGGHPPLVWIESSLHERPAKLQAALEEVVRTLDAGARAGEPVVVASVRPGQGPAAGRRELVRVEPVGDLVFGFGYCGGGLKGLASEERRLVFPRVDDCISLLLRAGDNGGSTSRDARSYYLTKGWFCHNSNVSEGRQPVGSRYGPERAAQLRRLAFAHYERVSLIATGAYDVDEWVGESEAFAAELDLENAIVRGSVDLLERLFLRAWDTDDIVVLDPGEAVAMHHILCDCRQIAVKQPVHGT